MQQLQKSERPHIAFFGCTNSGKSSLVNAIVNQNLSIVSDVKGTTTDSVSKSMEILPLGPVVIIDTAGVNDLSELGEQRTQKTKEVLDKTDIAVLVIDSLVGENEFDKNLISEFEMRKIPYLVVWNKVDLLISPPLEGGVLQVSALTGDGVNELKEKIGHLINENKKEKFIIKNRLQAGDIVIMVIPIDESAPKGRIILPQQNTLREILDAHATAICCGVNELEDILKKVTPKYVITDSQAFNEVKKIVPENIILTSFSILMANYKGELDILVNGAKKISELKDGDKVLISEGCTHHRQCNDIGTVKLPSWIKKYTNKNIEFEFTQGGEFPQDLSKFALIVHCGGCMLNEAEMKSRLKKANEQNIPIVNYGMAIAYMNGILERSMEIFRNE
ncbi:MAG: [FeFe] hydrogenase H-cluster maturation GTPase HydF [Cyanobacteria bacterium SIG31]|nr:[FeFe] hydrogenase H-cluster maturation GTPase HydF [Cyanobacteria bacterium SIG31]